MIESARQEIESCKEEFDLFVKHYLSALDKAKSEIDFIGLRTGLQFLREEIAKWDRAVR